MKAGSEGVVVLKGLEGEPILMWSGITYIESVVL